MTAENPAITLYKAWDGIYRATRGTLDSYFFQNLTNLNLKYPLDGLTAYPDLDNVPTESKGGWRVEQMIDHGTTISPVARHQGRQGDNQFVYEMSWKRHNYGRQSLFQLDAFGNFRFGSAFRRSPTKGVYDRVETHTFLSWNRLYRVQTRPIAWYYGGLGQRTWCDPTDWRTHLYYWIDGSLPAGAWLRLQPVGGTWQVAATKGMDLTRDTRIALEGDYQLAEGRYAKRRRKYYREQGIPDPDRPLNATDIETVDQLTQYLNVYDPPKARIPA